MRGYLRRTAFACLIGVLLVLGLAPTSAHADTLVAEFDVSSKLQTGISITGLDPSKFYRAEASGTFTYGGFATSLADAGCHTVLDSEPMTRFAMSILLQMPGALQLWVDNVNVQWVPENPSILGCDDPLFGGNHKYTVAFKPTSAVVNFRIKDNFYRDNGGSLHVKVFELTNPPVPETTLIPVGLVSVDSSNPTGASSLPLPQDFDYVIEAMGTYRYTRSMGFQADANCSITTADANWIPGRYGTFNGQPLLALLVNNGAPAWEPQAGGPSCDPLTHTYRAAFSPTASGPVTFRVHDTYHKDNSGVIGVVIYLVAPSG